MCWAILFVLTRSLVSFINGAAVALTLSLCKELKEFGFYIAKLFLLLWLLQPVSLQLCLRVLWELHRVWGSRGSLWGWLEATALLPSEGICQWQQDFSCHLLLS